MASFLPLLQTRTLKVTISLGSEIGWGWWTAGPRRCNPGESPPEGAFPTPSFHSSHLKATGCAGQPRPEAATLPPPPFLMPSCIRNPGKGALEAERRPEDDPAPASPHPLPQPCHKAAPTRLAVRPAAETQGRVATGSG